MKKTVKELANTFVETVKEFPQIVYIGDPVLRKNTDEIPFEESMKIGERLGNILTRYREKNGIGRGLAAPQIGVESRVFVTYLDEKVQIYINPQITWKSDEFNYYRELCLSSGTVWCDVKRAKSITMTWMNEKGESKEKTFDSFLARLMQHEYDHLEGIVNLDIAEDGSICLATDDPLKEELRDTPYK